MGNLEYFESITQEIHALKNRVRHFIKDRHWLSEGLWKESVIRAVLRRHLPTSLGVGTGFVVDSKDVSTQVDILIYDTTKPILFQDGDFIVVTPDLVRAIIEVKTCLSRSQMREQLRKLAEVHCFAASTALCQPFVGLFSYDSDQISYDCLHAALDEVADGSVRRIVHCVALGEDRFTRYWYCPPERPQCPENIWRSYHLPGIAPAYFIHNVIESLCERSVFDNSSVWFPREGKEQFMLGERRLTRGRQVAK